MVAFSARRLVCSAIDVITLITFPISALDSPSLATVELVDSATETAEVAKPVQDLVRDPTLPVDTVSVDVLPQGDVFKIQGKDDEVLGKK